MVSDATHSNPVIHPSSSTPIDSVKQPQSNISKVENTENRMANIFKSMIENLSGGSDSHANHKVTSLYPGGMLGFLKDIHKFQMKFGPGVAQAFFNYFMSKA
jgi:hypothetical protein